MLKYLLKRMTVIVFTVAIGLSLATLGLLYLVSTAYWPLLVVSITLNLWAIHQSERAGFVKAREYRRWKEPPRHFSAAQVIILYFLIMVEVAIAILLPFRDMM